MRPAGANHSSPGPPVPYAQFLSDPRFHLGLVILLAMTLLFSKLGTNGLPNYDDCYYAQKAKEILQTGDWMTVRFNGYPRFDNPPFFLWLVALSYKAFGVSEYAARFPSALLGVATIVLIYFFARKFFGTWVGFFSAFVLTTTFGFARHARRVMVDVTLTFFVCLALFALVLALEKDRRYFLLWGFSIALGCLTKSVLGLSPLAITVLYLLLTKRGRIFGDAYFLLGCLLLVAIGFSWYLHQYLTFGREFVDFHFGWLILERAYLQPPQPWYAHLSYFRELGLLYWPWLPFFVLGLVQLGRKAWQANKIALLLLLWVFTILLALTTVQTRYSWYILPIFPAAAVISGSALESLLKERGKLLFTKMALAFGLIALIGINATPLELSPRRDPGPLALAPYVKHFGDRGVRVIGFRQKYDRLNIPLLFYSGYVADPIVHTTAELAQQFEEGSPVLCVLNREDLDSVIREVPAVHVIKQAYRLALVSNQPLATAGVKTW